MLDVLRIAKLRQVYYNNSNTKLEQELLDREDQVEPHWNRHLLIFAWKADYAEKWKCWGGIQISEKAEIDIYIRNQQTQLGKYQQPPLVEEQGLCVATVKMKTLLVRCLHHIQRKRQMSSKTAHMYVIMKPQFLLMRPCRKFFF